MKILVCISHVPDTSTKIQIDGSGNSLAKPGVTFVICPYDEFALARAAEFKEKDGAQVTLISVGGPEVDPTLRKGLAITGDAAIRINTEPKDAYFVAKQIAEYAKSQNFDLIMFGKESIDFNGSMTAGMVAEMLDMPDVSFATSIEVTGGIAKISREIDGGTEKLECPLPLVLSAQKGLAEWRIPNIKGITASKSKPLTVLEPISVEPYTQTTALHLPASKQGCQYLQAEETDKLVQILAEKGAF